MKIMSHYQICSRCVMDTSDVNIDFDKDGICNHCKKRDELSISLQNYEHSKYSENIINIINKNVDNKKYNCIIGVSGGIDSSYVAYMVKKLGLKPLAVHLDNGWDSELSLYNIKSICDRLGIDLCTRVINWNEFRDLQLSFLTASTPDTEVITDHAIIATLYEEAIRNNIKYIIDGCNINSESHLPRSWSRGHQDWRYIKSIQYRFGTHELKDYPHYSLTKYQYYKFKIKRISILNYLNYSPKTAIKLLEQELDWKYYGGKHFESIFTKFFQGFILPEKFGIDKRRSHLSSLICSGDISREKALSELKEKPYSNFKALEKDRKFVINKLGIAEDAFNKIMTSTIKSFWDYPSYEKLFAFYKREKK